SSLTLTVPLMMRDTVLADTPASRAITLRVTARRGRGPLLPGFCRLALIEPAPESLPDLRPLPIHTPAVAAARPIYACSGRLARSPPMSCHESRDRVVLLTPTPPPRRARRPGRCPRL